MASRSPGSKISAILRQEIRRPAPGAVQQLAELAAARHGGVEAVLFYGSCLRDGSSLEDSVVDLLVLVQDYARAHTSSFARVANAVLPPNVYFLESTFCDPPVRAKYAVVRTKEFCRRTSGQVREPYFWARFAQPCILVCCKNREIESAVLSALASAVNTIVRETCGLMPPIFSARELWTRAFNETYRTELRAEASERPSQIFDSAPNRYTALADLLLLKKTGSDRYQRPPVSGAGRVQARMRWRMRRPVGKLLTVLRLVKAAFTFQGGPEYLAWKIQRHSGVEVRLQPWQKRYPVLGGLSLFVSLRRRGAFR